jgi:hypothetical protein
MFFRHALYQLSYPGKFLFACKKRKGRPFALVGDDGLEPPTTSV